MESAPRGVYWAFIMKSVLFSIALLITASAANADVRITMQNGRVSVVAKDATVRQILTEWARVGQTKIVNIERVPGGPVTLELTDVPEAQALEVLLRSLSGYIAAPRAVSSASLSQFDRIIIMPTIASARSALSAAPPPPVFQAPQFTPAPAANEDDEEQRPAQGMPVPPARGPVFNTFPQPQVVTPQTGAPAAFPGQQPVTGGMPQQQPQAAQPVNSTSPYGGGVAVPGMIVPVPQQPGQGQPGQIQGQPGQVQPGQIQNPQQPGQVQSQQPGQPVRRPGGND